MTKVLEIKEINKISTVRAGKVYKVVNVLLEGEYKHVEETDNPVGQLHETDEVSSK